MDSDDDSVLVDHDGSCEQPSINSIAASSIL